MREAREFRSRLFIEWNDQILTTKLIINGANKKEAKTNASLAWLEAFLNNDLMEVSEVMSELDESTLNDLQEFQYPKKNPKLTLEIEELLHKNPVSQLNNFCQKEHIKKPSYKYVKKDAFFICEASVRYRGKVYQGEGADLNKKGAQKIAADKVLTAMGNLSHFPRVKI